MKNIILVSLVTLLSFPTLAETCGQHLDKGIPSSDSDQFLCRDGYAVGYNYNTKNADWVAYHITAESVNITNKRSNAFQEDTEMPDYARSTLADYKGSGYDRGHLAPSATMDFTQESM
ncbi:nuclease C1, partial [Vibrio parahaemolyticus VPTS-2010_2]